jgi:hypothetical protein
MYLNGAQQREIDSGKKLDKNHKRKTWLEAKTIL